MYACVNVCVCVYSLASIGSLFLISSCFKLFVRIWSHSLPSAVCGEFDSRFPCHLWRTNPEFGIGALWIFLCSSPPHTAFWRQCKRHCWFPSKLVSVPEVLKTSNLWRSRLWVPLPPSTTATWKFSFAEATTSFNLFVLSVLNGGDASSDSKSYLMAAWARLKKVGWSCHKHPSGFKSNSVSSAPSSISQIFSFSISSHFHIQICGSVTGECNRLILIAGLTEWWGSNLYQNCSLILKSPYSKDHEQD